MLPRSVVPKVGPARLTCFFFLSALRLLKAQIFNIIYPHQKTRRCLQLRRIAILKTLLNSCQKQQLSQQVMERYVTVNKAERRAGTSRCPKLSTMTKPEPVGAIIRRCHEGCFHQRGMPHRRGEAVQFCSGVMRQFDTKH